MECCRWTVRRVLLCALQSACYVCGAPLSFSSLISIPSLLRPINLSNADHHLLLGLAVVKHGVEPKIGLFQDEVDKGLLDYVTGLVSRLGFSPILI